MVLSEIKNIGNVLSLNYRRISKITKKQHEHISVAKYITVGSLVVICFGIKVTKNTKKKCVKLRIKTFFIRQFIRTVGLRIGEIEYV